MVLFHARSRLSACPPLSLSAFVRANRQHWPSLSPPPSCPARAAFQDAWESPSDPHSSLGISYLTKIDTSRSKSACAGNSLHPGRRRWGRRRVLARRNARMERRGGVACACVSGFSPHTRWLTWGKRLAPVGLSKPRPARPEMTKKMRKMNERLVAGGNPSFFLTNFGVNGSNCDAEGTLDDQRSFPLRLTRSCKKLYV